MGKRTIINTIRWILFIISAILISYLLLLEKGINPKLNHLLKRNNYFWIFVLLIALVFIVISYIVAIYIVRPCFIHPLFDTIYKF